MADASELVLTYGQRPPALFAKPSSIEMLRAEALAHFDPPGGEEGSRLNVRVYRMMVLADPLLMPASKRVKLQEDEGNPAGASTPALRKVEISDSFFPHLACGTELHVEFVEVPAASRTSDNTGSFSRTSTNPARKKEGFAGTLLQGGDVGELRAEPSEETARPAPVEMEGDTGRHAAGEAANDTTTDVASNRTAPAHQRAEHDRTSRTMQTPWDVLSACTQRMTHEEGAGNNTCTFDWDGTRRCGVCGGEVVGTECFLCHAAYEAVPEPDIPDFGERKACPRCRCSVEKLYLKSGTDRWYIYACCDLDCGWECGSDGDSQYSDTTKLEDAECDQDEMEWGWGDLCVPPSDSGCVFDSNSRCSVHEYGREEEMVYSDETEESDSPLNEGTEASSTEADRGTSLTAGDVDDGDAGEVGVAGEGEVASVENDDASGQEGEPAELSEGPAGAQADAEQEADDEESDVGEHGAADSEGSEGEDMLFSDVPAADTTGEFPLPLES